MTDKTTMLPSQLTISFSEILDVADVINDRPGNVFSNVWDDGTWWLISHVRLSLVYTGNIRVFFVNGLET